MDESPIDALRELIVKTLEGCVDPDVLDLIYKLLCSL